MDKKYGGHKGGSKAGGHVSPQVPAWVYAPEPAPWKANKGLAQEEICKRLEHGLPLSSFVSPKDPTMPAYTTVLMWLREDEKFKEKYDRSRKIQAQLWVDQMMELAFSPTWVMELNPEMQAKIDSGEVSPIVLQGLMKAATSSEMQRRRLLIDCIKWFAGKMMPKLYGTGTVKDNVDDDDDVIVECITYKEGEDKDER